MTLRTVRIGSNDLDKALKFYDAIFAPLGVGPSLSQPSVGVLVYPMANGPRFMVGKPRNGEPVVANNGGTIMFEASDPAVVDAWHAAGVANGGASCEDPPGPRAIVEGSYGAYLRDPDGHKLGCFSGLG